jgi:hypothetical protein
MEPLKSRYLTPALMLSEKEGSYIYLFLLRERISHIMNTYHLKEDTTLTRTLNRPESHFSRRLRNLSTLIPLEKVPGKCNLQTSH